MSGIHFIGGEKGGVGKSVVARILAQYLIDHQLPFAAFDSDRSHGALLRYYGDYAESVVIDRYESLDGVIEAAAAGPAQRVLVDLAAQTYGQFWQWFSDSGVAELTEELGIALNYWHVMDASSDSLRLLGQLLDERDERLQLVVVLNEIRGDKFELLAHSGLRERAEAAGARFMRLHRLPDATMQKIDGGGYSFWAAANASGKGLGLLERQRLKVWLQRAYAEIDQLGV
ncbi:mobilization protein [Corticibacter populi]|uniref:Mobilization protein n=1 Tax=Corticibacter populi TaxID=1550736 RepID=A0A3M6QRX6_9BURK|nr:mobilization protein [Corticibacter populi]RMX05787.1 mobilization protein [Corticibacter populi]RZS30904.1 CobQ/CobB/MinD/ParA family nucleotide binding protein [Corticibacter populi]